MRRAAGGRAVARLRARVGSVASRPGLGRAVARAGGVGVAAAVAGACPAAASPLPPQPGARAASHGNAGSLPSATATRHRRRRSPPAPPQPGSPGGPAPSAATPAVKLAFKGPGGDPPFLLAGQSVVLAGTVTPYVAGQQAVITVSYHGRKRPPVTVPIAPAPGGQGAFTLPYRARRAGTLTVRAIHAATPQLGAFASAAAHIRVARGSAHPGSGGLTVRVLQSALSRLHYGVPVDGRFDSATARAVVAYRKVSGLARVSSVNGSVMRRLQRGQGAFHVRFPGHGRHVEANLSAQVLAEIDAGGHVHRVYTMSSGKPSTPTVTGHFHVYSKTPGTNAKGMVDANYFIGGYAIHGYHDVPVFAASHGCLRIPIPDAAPVFGWIHLGTAVDVYSRHGGSHRVRHHGVGP